MKAILNISREVNLTLNSINGIKRATTSAFFYAQIHNKLNNSTTNRWDRISEIICKPAYAVLMISILFTIDIITLSLQQDQNDSLPPGSIAAQYQELFAISDYFYDVSDETRAVDVSK